MQEMVAYENPWAEAPAPGEMTAVAPGVLWARLPLRLAIDHVNVWALRDGEGWTIVDTGMHAPATEEAWEGLFAGPLEGRPVIRVIVTHLHPDHVGMAGWLTKRFECELWMTELEYLAARDATVRRDEVFQSAFRGFFRAAGFTRDEVAQLQNSFASFGRYYHPLPEDYRRIRDGEQITIGEHEWSVIIGSGHSPEHACLLNPSLGLLISGDQVLQRISSNVSVIPNQPAANPLQNWLDSLDKLRSTVKDDVLVLPSHDVPFRGLYRRLQELRAHHQVALARLRDALDKPRCAAELFEVMFGRKIPARLTYLATGETQSHLNYLLAAGLISRHVDGDGVAWFQRC